MFPRLNKRRTAHILCDGIRVDQTDLDYTVAIKLAELDLIKAEQHKSVRCANPEDPDYPERQNRACEGVIEVGSLTRIYYCPECGQPVGNIARKKQFEAVEITLNPKGIVSFVKRSIRSLTNVKTIDTLAYGVFSVSLTDGRKLQLVVLDYAEARYRFAGLYFSEPCLYVIVSPINEPITHVLEEPSYTQFTDILSQEAGWLAGKLDLAAYPVPDRMALAPVEQKFDAMLAKPKGWQHFEQVFTPALQRHISENPALLNGYLGQLRRLSGTVFNYFNVPIGGADRTDMRPINKLQLMNEVFEGNAIVDAKRYVKSSLEQEHIDKILRHLEVDPQRPRRAVIFLSTNRVSPSAWEVVMQLRNKNSYWKIIVLTKYMLLELLTSLEAIELLELE